MFLPVSKLIAKAHPWGTYSRIATRVSRALLLVLISLFCVKGAVALAQDVHLEDLFRQPEIALYKAYAEFKMARYDSARQIWVKLAEGGVAEAWFNLGILAEDGLGQARDPFGAMVYYRKGAEAGSTKAQFRLALAYLEGRLVGANRGMAEHWLRAAAESGYEDAALQLEQLASGAESNDYLSVRMLEAEGEVELAAEAFRRLSESGNLRARTRLAWMYEAGRGVEQNLSEAALLFRSAAEAGDAEAQFALSVMLSTGAGVERDEEAARQWLRRSASLGYPEAVGSFRRQEGLQKQ